MNIKVLCSKYGEVYGKENCAQCHYVEQYKADGRVFKCQYAQKIEDIKDD